MSGKYLKDFSSQARDTQLDDCVFITTHQIFQAKRFHNVTRTDSGVVFLVDEPEWQNSLFLKAIISGTLDVIFACYLQVCFMNTSEGTRDNHGTTCKVIPQPSSTCMNNELVP